MKLLLYCTKAKPYLEFKQIPRTLMEIDNSFEGYRCSWERTEDDPDFQINGKIVAECDFEVDWCDTSWCCNDFIEHKGLEKSCLTKEQLFDYVKGRNEFYAIHIKNLHIFDEPRFIQDYSKNENPYNYIENAPQNMMNAYDVKSFKDYEKYVLISIRPEWLCKILNGEKTIEVRKKVLKEMIK